MRPPSYPDPIRQQHFRTSEASSGAPSTGTVILRNLLAPTTLFIALLTLVLVAIGQFGDALFLASTLSVNTAIAVIQEVRARQAVAALALVQPVQVRRITERGEKLVAAESVRPGDHLRFLAGDAVPVDGEVIERDGFQVDESLLTGESLPVAKTIGAEVLAGSSVLAGAASVRVAATGTQTKAEQMAVRLRWYDQKLTPLQENLLSLIRWFTYGAFGVSIFLFIRHLGTQLPLTDTVNAVVAGALSLVPEGLLLASTVLFSYGAVTLARRQVLVQRLASVEGFARLQTLCLDKTGTLTERMPMVEEIIPLPGYDAAAVEQQLAALVHGEPAPNQTLRAIAAVLPEVAVTVSEVVPFDSTQKWSAVAFRSGGRGARGGDERYVVLGAPEVLAARVPLPATVRDQIAERTDAGARVLLLADFSGAGRTLPQAVLQRGRPAALITLRNRLRPSVIDTIFYLQAHDVAIKVLSGDSAATVCHVAAQVGIRHPERVLTGDQLAAFSPVEWERQVPGATIFARVLPEQKERLIRTFQAHGFTGMVGDGVNDTLALKAADLGVAMADGSAAARAVADVVLLGNSFAIFPIGMRVAARVILGLEQVASLFLNKVVYSAVLLLSGLTWGFPYPLQARHLLFINLFTIGLPTLLWSFFPPEPRDRQDPTQFLARTFRFALPIGVTTGCAVLVAYLVARGQVFSWSVSADQLQTPRLVATLVVTVLGMHAVWLIPRWFGAIESLALRTLQIGYLVVAGTGLLLALQSERFVSGFFKTAGIGWLNWVVVVGLLGLALRGQKVAVEQGGSR